MARIFLLVLLRSNSETVDLPIQRPRDGLVVQPIGVTPIRHMFVDWVDNKVFQNRLKRLQDECFMNMV
jgi:hypothetical protein